MEWAFKDWERNLMEKFVDLASDEKAREKGDCNRLLFLEFQKLCGLFLSTRVQFLFANGSLKRRFRKLWIEIRRFPSIEHLLRPSPCCRTLPS